MTYAIMWFNHWLRARVSLFEGNSESCGQISLPIGRIGNSHGGRLVWIVTPIMNVHIACELFLISSRACVHVCNTNVCIDFDWSVVSEDLVGVHIC